MHSYIFEIESCIIFRKNLLLVTTFRMLWCCTNLEYISIFIYLNFEISNAEKINQLSNDNYETKFLENLYWHNYSSKNALLLINKRETTILFPYVLLQLRFLTQFYTRFIITHIFLPQGLFQPFHKKRFF